MNKLIGAQYYTIRDFCQTLEDFRESCRKVRDIGYKVVQLSGIGDFDGKDVKSILDEFGLICACTHRPPQNYLENIEKEIEFHKTIGCKVCGIGAMPGFNGDAETVEKFVNNFKPVIEKLWENGLIFAYHNHAFEFEKIDGKYVFDIITEGMNHDGFKYILDVYWLSFAGVNPVKFINEHKDNIACVHFKDLKVKNSTPVFAEIGNGNLDWDEIIKACDESEAEYALVEQDICEGNPFDSLEISYNYLKNKGFE